MEKLLEVSFMILWLQLARVNSQQEQDHQTLSIQEGENATMNCSYKTSISYLQWYKQDSGRGLALLILIRSNEKEKNSGRLRVTLDTSLKSSSLSIVASQTADTATYFCATEGEDNNDLRFGAGTRLTVKPSIENPDPAVYELKNPKSGKSVCLFTDFDSQDNEKQTMEHSMIKLDSTVLDMKTMDSKSNGALAWNDSFNLGCNSAFNKPYHSSSEFPCDAKLVEKGFETDMNLNFHNLMVIMLRILFLKVVGFNLLMTLRLWSS